MATKPWGRGSPCLSRVPGLGFKGQKVHEGVGEGKSASMWHLPVLCQGQRKRSPKRHPTSLLCMEGRWKLREGSRRVREDISLSITAGLDEPQS